MAAFAVVAFAVAASTGTAFGRSKTTISSAGYEQSGQLSYTAPVARSSIYGPAGLSSGQPIYLVAVKQLHLRFVYRFRSARPATVSGSERLVVTISNGQGVVRRIPLVAPTVFSGDHFVATAVLRLASVKRLAAVFEGAVGAQLDASSYSVTFRPSVVVTGKLGGVPLLAGFDPSIPFTYTGGVLTPSVAGPSANYLGAPNSASSLTTSSPKPQLTASKSGSVQLPGIRTAYLFGKLTVADARLASLAALALFLLLVALAGRSFAKARSSRDERSRIASRHRAALVTVGALPTAPEVVVVEISSFQGLMRIARRLECPILSEGGDEASAYGVVDNGTLYCYRPLPRPGGGVPGRGVAERGDASQGENVRALPSRSGPSVTTPVRQVERLALPEVVGFELSRVVEH